MTICALTPAKINLGLEVVRRRNDGFHDIATVFQTISVFDRLSLSLAPEDAVRTPDRIEQIEPNLISRAIELARKRGLTSAHWHVELEKRIPIAAGLGGASADAAATLVMLAEREQRPVRFLPEYAFELGSDVPFLLTGGAALASGRGEMLDPLPPLRGIWFVIAAPAIELAQNTARLYGALRPEDFSNGARVQRVADAMRAHSSPSHVDLVNSFERPLVDLVPEVTALRSSFLRAGAPFVALSGAGPAHYTIVPALSDAIRIASALSSHRPLPMRILVARPVARGPILMSEKTTNPVETL